MSETVGHVLFYIVILLANVIQCITGFAGSVLAMPFGIMLVGYDVAKPIINILAIFASVGVVIAARKHINYREFVKIIAVMLPGIVCGALIIHYVPIDSNISKAILYFVLAGIVLVFTAIGVYTTFFAKKDEDEETGKKHKKIKTIISYVILALAGIVHGIYVCGGPLLVLYASQRLKEKDEFRGTLSLSWIALNTVVLVSDILNGFFGTEALPDLMITLGISSAVLVASILIGNLIANKLNGSAFMIITYALMAISGISLIINACGAL